VIRSWRDYHPDLKQPDPTKAPAEDVLRAMEAQGWKTEFDKANIFILENWHCGLILRDKPPRKAVELIRAANICTMSSDPVKAVAWYVKRRKRLALRGHRPSKNRDEK